MTNVAVYIGTGGYMAEDVKVFLASHSIGFNELTEEDICKGKLDDFDTLIIGGGTINEIIPALTPRGVYKIRKFVASGRRYIGICAGAYIAAKFFIDLRGNKHRGIGLSQSSYIRGLGQEIGETKFKNEQKIKLFYCNGPLINHLSKFDELLAHDQSGKITVLKSKYFLGQAILFSAHPEGNSFSKVSATELGAENFFENVIRNG